MLANLASMPVVAAGAVVASHSQFSRPPMLEHIFQRVKLSLVPFNAQDVYQICTLAFHTDALGMMQDADFMRGVSDSFAHADQSVLTPFQVNLVTDTFKKCGIWVSPKEVMVPDEEAVSPESLLEVLRAMNVMRQRDETKLENVLKLMVPLLDEFTPSQLAQTIVELGKLKSTTDDIMNILAKRILLVMEDLNALDISLVAKNLCECRGISPMVLRRYLTAVEKYYPDFQPEDYVNLLVGLRSLGSSYINLFTRLVEHGLDQVENMDGVTLTHYLISFNVMGYLQRTHIEIYADALVSIASDLAGRELVQAFVALDQLQLLNEELFGLMIQCLARYAPTMPPAHLSPVIDVCSHSPYSSELIMDLLLNRIMECIRLFTPHQLAEVTDLISLYPPAREHPMVPLLGQQGRLRIEIMGSTPLAMITRGLSNLGYSDPEFYSLAVETGCRYGFKDWSQLAPIIRGLTISGGCSMTVTKILASHIAPMTKSMQLQDVLLANRFLCELGCEDDYVFRAMATRVLQFVKEVTPDMPEDLQLLLQRGATLMNQQSGGGR